MKFNLENIAETKRALIDFETEIAELYKAGKIKAPIHLSKGNEEPLIDIFRNIQPEDWIFSTWRSHYHALLKGIDPEWLKKEIIERRSIHIINPEHNFYSSAIVAGNLPIALGTAYALKLKKSENGVWVFSGDMAAKTGAFHEATKYAQGHDLPIKFVVEDNSWSVDTPTQEVWDPENAQGKVMRYKYERGYPHHGSGVWVNF